MTMKVTLIPRYKNAISSTLTKIILDDWCPYVFRWLQRKKLLTSAQNKKELLLVLVNSRDSARFNKAFRKRDKPTDVLSFAPIEKTGFGELVLCVPVLKIQARDHGQSLEKELGYMIIHGVLHLLGFDHEKSPREARRMFKIQDDLFMDICTRHDRMPHGHRNRNFRS